MLSPTTADETGEFALLISDSDRVQKEAAVLRRPLITVRMSTERPEAPQDLASPVEPGPTIGEQARALLTDLPGTRQRLESLIRERVQGW